MWRMLVGRLRLPTPAYRLSQRTSTLAATRDIQHWDNFVDMHLQTTKANFHYDSPGPFLLPHWRSCTSAVGDSNDLLLRPRSIISLQQQNNRVGEDCLNSIPSLQEQPDDGNPGLWTDIYSIMMIVATTSPAGGRRWWQAPQNLLQRVLEMAQTGVSKSFQNRVFYKPRYLGFEFFC